MRQAPPKALLFDLDGTLLDTARDFVRLIHTLCDANAYPRPDVASIRAKVSEGAVAMTSLIDPQMSQDQSLRLVDAFLDAYRANISVDTCYFVGIESLLEHLITRTKIAIVTNKPKTLAGALVRAQNVPHHLLVCPEDAPAKPAPDMLLYACTHFGIKAQDALYIGDHVRDIKAAMRANMPSIALDYGYKTPQDGAFDTWGATYALATPLDLCQHLLALYKVNTGNVESIR